MCDKLIFDLAQEVEGSPNVFVRKDWINLLDNQNQNYNNNQSVIDTSQIANSNKYVSYREGYLSMPLLVTLAKQSTTLTTAVGTVLTFNPTTSTTSADYAVGLKNWFGSMIHSFTLDYNGTTIVQQTPLINMWNSFKLLTTLSYNDIITQGATIGFYPDNASSVSIRDVIAIDGLGTFNNRNLIGEIEVDSAFSTLSQKGGNDGFLTRQRWISFDLDGIVGTSTYGNFYNGNPSTAASGNFINLWKSYISNKSAGANTNGVIQWSIVATVYLKHIHSFFNMCPLIKGSFMKMTMNLNNTSTTFSVTSNVSLANPGVLSAPVMTCTDVQNAVGGVNPLMIASVFSTNGGKCLQGISSGSTTTAGTVTANYKMNISVGSLCLDSSLVSTTGVTAGTLSKSIFLYIPTYTFNPIFEQAYLSSPIKPIKYTDIYQYQVLNVTSGQSYNNLVTNGISNIKSILILPYFSSSSATIATGSFKSGTPQYQSPFDPAGCGPTSPFVSLTNFNVQISGQNAIYNMEKYNFEHFNNQLYGQNAVNGGLTDGLTSGLIDRDAFDTSYCYYYLNLERMLPVEQSVPKSIQILGLNNSSRSLDLIVFVEYYNSISIDVLTGSRVA
jgi:hypothetical protein